MKVQTIIDFYVVMGDVSKEGTSFQGYLPDGTTYKDITKVFGSPQSRQSLDGKVQVEWVGRLNGLLFTIYDYKSKIFPEQNTNWHIGGTIELTADLVNAYYKYFLTKQPSGSIVKKNR